MASGFDRHSFMAGLARAEQQTTRALRSMQAPYADACMGGQDWVFHNGQRLYRVERALDGSMALALSILGQRLKGIDLGAVWPILCSVLNDIALYIGGSAVVGGALGAGIGLFAAGIGAAPGAMIGAMLGVEVATVLLNLLGLTTLIADMAASLPQAARCYALGFRTAWGPTPRDGRRDGGAAPTLYRADLEYLMPPEFASRDFADGHVIIVLAMLTAIVSYLTRGKGNVATLAADFRHSARLGQKMATWVEHNAEALTNHPLLQSVDKASKADGAGRSTANEKHPLAGARTAGLRQAKQLIGLSEGGGGTWNRSPKRSGGEAYQEQITGVEREIEYDVPYAGAPGGKISFDGYDAERGVLLDAKDWKGYPPLDATFWQDGVEKQAKDQIRAAGGVPIEWHFSTKSGLDAVRTLFKDSHIESIKLILTPHNL